MTLQGHRILTPGDRIDKSVSLALIARRPRMLSSSFRQVMLRTGSLQLFTAGSVIRSADMDLLDSVCFPRTESLFA